MKLFDGRNSAHNLNNLSDCLTQYLFTFFSPKEAALLGVTCKKLLNIERASFDKFIKDYTKPLGHETIKVPNAPKCFKIKMLSNGHFAIANRDCGITLLNNRFEKIPIENQMGSTRTMATMGNLIIAGSTHGGIVMVWDGTNGNLIHSFHLPCEEKFPDVNLIEGLAPLSKDLCLATHRVSNASQAGSLYLLNFKMGSYTLLLKNEILAFSDLTRLSQNSFAAVNSDNSIIIFELESNHVLKQVNILAQNHSETRSLLAFNETILLSATSSTISIWDLKTAKVLRNLTKPAGSEMISDIVKLDNFHFATGSHYGLGDKLIIWDIRKNQPVNYLLSDKNDNPPHGVEKLPNNDIMTCSTNGTLQRWSFETLKPSQDQSLQNLARLSRCHLL